MCDADRPPCKEIKTLHTFHTPFNADSVEWCPHEPFRNYFVCANYQLRGDPEISVKNKRVGCILLFSVNNDCLQLQQTVYTAGILDQKWCHNAIDNLSLLGVVDAESTLWIYALDPDLKELKLITSCRIEGEEETLLLSLDWSTGKFHSSEPEIVCSDSKGKIHKFQFKKNDLVKEGTYNGHSFEAWITAFYYWNENIFFSGGDDCLFLKFDKRTGSQPVTRNKSHEAGVTSMHSNSEKEHLLATGSYDSFVRLWDIRFLKNPTCSIKTPGTLWRLKWDPFYHNYLLSACMLGGVHLIQAHNSNLEIVDSYYHENLAYGCDWSSLPVDSNELAMIATCSFYDNLLCISTVRLRQTNSIF